MIAEVRLVNNEFVVEVGGVALLAPLVSQAANYAAEAEGYADQAAEEVAALNVAMQLTDTVADKLIRLKVQNSEGDEVLIADVSDDADEGVAFHLPVSVPAGNWPADSLAPDVLTRLAFETGAETTDVLFRMVAADAGGQRREVMRVSKDARHPWVAYVGQAQAVTGLPALSATHLIECLRDDDGVFQLFARDRSGGARLQLTTGATDATTPAFDPGGDLIFQRDGELWFVPVAGGATVPVKSKRDLVFVGDSMSDFGSSYADEVRAAVPDRTAYDSAEGGERTRGIAISFGVPGLLTLAVTGNAIPTSGDVAVTPSVPFLNDGASSVVTVGGRECSVWRTGSNYRLAPLTYPGAPVAVSNPAPATVLSLQIAGTSAAAATRLVEVHQATALIRVGRNDVDKVDFSQAQVLADVQAMIDALTPKTKHYLVLGVTNGTVDLPTSMGGSKATEADSATVLSRIAALNLALAAAHGGAFVDPLANHVALGGSTSRTVNGQTFDVLNSSVLSDGLHESTTGRANTAALVVAALNSRSL